MMKKIKGAFHFVIIVFILAGIFLCWMPCSGSILSSEKEILEIDPEKTKRFKIQGVNFDLKNCVFVDKNGNAARGKIKIKFKNFNEPDSVISSKYDLVYKKNSRILPFVSGGMFDLNIYSKKNKLNIKKNSYIRINYPVLRILAKDDIKEMKIYSVNEKTGSWKYESRPVIAKLDNKEYFKFKVTHLSYWNIDYPLNTHACIKGKVKFEDGRDLPDNSVRVFAIGKNYIGRTSAFAVKGKYEMDVRQSFKIKVIAVSGDGWAGILKDISIGDKQGRTGQSESTQNYKYEMPDIILSKEKFKELSKKYHRRERVYSISKKLKRVVPFGEEVKRSHTKEKIIFEATVVKRKIYFKAWVDGDEKEGIIYNPGKTIRLEADNAIQLQIGSAGSLNVKINNQPCNLGKVGEIANKIIEWKKDPNDEARYNLIIRDWIKYRLAPIPYANMDLGEFTINIKGDDKKPHFVRVKIHLGYKEKDMTLQDELGKRRIQIRDIINMVISGKSKKELEKPEAKEKLKIEIKDRINRILKKGKIDAVYFEDLAFM